MWSVVMHVAEQAEHAGATDVADGPGCAGMPSKYGARLMYVEVGSQAKRSPSGTGKPRQRSFALNTLA